jgi:signal transduction histidine kinase
VSASTNVARVSSRRPRESVGPSREPKSLRVLEVVGVTLVASLLIWQVVGNWADFTGTFLALLPWIAVVVLADLVPVPLWGSAQLMMSFPVLLAAAFVFPPYVAGALSFVATVDTREFRREITAGRGLLNRSNVALSVMAASWVFYAIGGSVSIWPSVLPAALVALLVDLTINASLLILGTRLLTGLPATRLIHNVYGGSHTLAFSTGYACFGLLAVVLATLYSSAGAWGLVAFAVPLFLARQMFVHWKKLAEAEVRLDVERRALTQVSSRIADERKDERLAVAAGIHDEILPPLYKVHLLGQVLRQDLASGRLLDLDADVPDLLQATEAASRALRDLIQDLRKSTLGAGGLPQTLELLARDLSDESGISIEVSVSLVSGTPLIHLLLYQVAREAIVNVVRHSGADKARVVLEGSVGEVRLFVEDNGRGFQPTLVDQTAHFGLQLMRERVELAGGILYIETAPNTGTRVMVKIPIDRESPE